MTKTIFIQELNIIYGDNIAANGFTVIGCQLIIYPLITIMWTWKYKPFHAELIS